MQRTARINANKTLNAIFFALLKHLKECTLGKYLTPQEDPNKMYKMDNLDTVSGMKDCSGENEEGKFHLIMKDTYIRVKYF